MQIKQLTPNLYIARFQRRVKRLHRWNLFYDILAEIAGLIVIYLIFFLILSMSVPQAEILSHV